MIKVNRKIGFTIVASAVLFITGYKMWYLIHLIIYKPDAVSIDWNDMGPTPMYKVRYTPQGMTWVNGFLVFANSWKNSKKGNIIAYYKNHGFSQGLVSDGGFLYESENKSPFAVINKIDINKVFETRKLSKATVAQYKMPARGVEDLAFDGDFF